MADRLEWVETILAVVGQTYAEITPFGSEITQVRADVMSLLDRLQDTVKATGDDDTANFGAAERAERIACNSREEVRGRSDTLNALVRARRADQCLGPAGQASAIGRPRHPGRDSAAFDPHPRHGRPSTPCTRRGCGHARSA
jgi:hypothetical protein